MLLKILLGLRNHKERVGIVKPNGQARPVLGTSHPQEENRRAAVLKYWNIPAGSPRQRSPATIDELLPQRTQTILSHRLAPELRQRINSGMNIAVDSRLKNRSGKQEEAELEPPETGE